MSIERIKEEDANANANYFQNAKEWNTIAKFKDDIVNALSQIEDKVTNKNNSIESMINAKNSVFETRLAEMDNSIKLINTKLNQLFGMQDKLKDVLPLQQKNNETLISHEIRLNNLSKEISSSCYKYDKIVLDNLIVPGQVGEYCKFKNVKECLDYTLNQLAVFNSYKEKSSADFKLFKEKIDQTQKKHGMDLEITKDGVNRYVKERLELTDKKFDDKINEYINLVHETKMENNTYAAQLKEISTELKKEMNKMLNLKDEIVKHNTETKLYVDEVTQSTMESFTSMRSDFTKINRHFTEIVDFIKDVRFKKNINSEVTKQDIKKLANNLLDNSQTNISNNSPENKQTINNTIDDCASENESTKLLPPHSQSNNTTLTTLTPLTFNQKFKKTSLSSSIGLIATSKTKNLMIQSPSSIDASPMHVNSETIDLPNLNRKINHYRNTVAHSREDKKLNITIDNDTDLRYKKSVSKNKKKLNAVLRNNSEPKTLVQKRKKTSNEGVPKKKKEHYVYKMIKNESGKLTKTSSLCYFKPKKTVQ